MNSDDNRNETRKLILARRTQLISVALASAGIAVAAGSCKPCLSVHPVSEVNLEDAAAPTKPGSDAGVDELDPAADAGAETESDAAPPPPRPCLTPPKPCLKPAPPPSGTPPQVCLEFTLPPGACLKAPALEPDLAQHQAGKPQPANRAKAHDKDRKRTG